MEDEKHKDRTFKSAKGTAGDVSMDRRPDGKWGFSWWCPMPNGDNGDPAEFADGRGIADTETEAVELARSQADKQGR